MEINYKHLLKKYIEHVGDEEGVDFIPKDGWDARTSSFSDDELEVLWDLAGWDPKQRKYT